MTTAYCIPQTASAAVRLLERVRRRQQQGVRPAPLGGLAEDGETVSEVRARLVPALLDGQFVVADGLVPELAPGRRGGPFLQLGGGGAGRGPQADQDVGLGPQQRRHEELRARLPVGDAVHQVVHAGGERIESAAHLGGGTRHRVGDVGDGVGTCDQVPHLPTYV
jgi:hypothetical protein